MNESPQILACVLHDRNSRRAVLTKTIAALSRQNGLQCDILLINAGTDEQFQSELQQRFPRLILQSLPPGSGIVAGRNRGLRYFLQGTYQFLLNLDDDIALNPNCLAALLCELQNNPEIGMVAPLILAGDQSILSSGGDYYYCLGQPHLRNKPLQALSKDNGFLTGTIGLLRRKAVQQAGFFDPIFDPYGFEDIDYCLRMRNAGYQLAVNPQAVSCHLTDFSFHLPTAFSLYYTTKNRILCARKHCRRVFFMFLFLPWSIVRRGLYPACKYMIYGRFDLCTSIFKAFRDSFLQKPLPSNRPAA